VVGKAYEGSKFSEFIVGEHLVNKLPIYQIGSGDL
jgi:hypothetical protein